MTTHEQIEKLLTELQKHPDAMDDLRSELRTFTNSAFAAARSCGTITARYAMIEGARVIFRDNLLILCARLGITPPIPFIDMREEKNNAQG